jgi:hypothetical protein
VALQKKVDLDDEEIKKVRIYEANTGKIYRELPEGSDISRLNEYVSLYAEKIPDEELNMQEDERLINAFNFDREPTKAHGIPFKFVVKPVSTLLLLGRSYLTMTRVRYSKRPKNDYRSAQESKASNSKRSSLPLSLVECIKMPSTLKTVLNPSLTRYRRTGR